jgi:hypothetical protein
MTTHSQPRPRPLDRLYANKIKPTLIAIASSLKRKKDKSLKDKLSHIGRVTEKKRKG